MFLNELKPENKELFLKLCVFTSLANGVFADEEKKIIAAYCREMDIPEIIPETKESLEEILERIRDNADSVEKNIIILEILGLVKADGICDQEEQEFINNLIGKIGAKKDVLPKLESILTKYTDVYKELVLAINE